METERVELSASKVDAWRAILTAAFRCIANVDRIFAENDMISTDVYDVLVTLEYADGHRLRMAQLAEQTLFSRSGLTRLVDRLVLRGYVLRESCPMDRRGAFAVLTPAGKAERERAWPLMRAEIGRVLGEDLTDEMAESLSHLFWGMVRRAERSPSHL